MIRVDGLLRASALVATLALAAAPALAIVIRHDKDDALFRELGTKYPAAVDILPDGSGVLIAPEWVLTAGHVARGVAGRDPRVEAEGREYGVARVFLHPEWKELAHDMALLRLKEPVEGIAPVKPYDRDDEVGQEVTFVGRGDFGTGLTGPREADGVKRGATNVVEDADADWVYFTFDAPESGTALEGVSGPGDSGGPALVTRDGALYTIGVSVFSNSDHGPGRYGLREGYTRVSTHRGWIAEVLAGKHDAAAFAPGAAPARAQSKRKGPRSGPGPGGALGVSIGPLPDSAAGRLVRDYIKAYNSGDWATMDAFSITHFSGSFLEGSTPQERRERYERLRDEHFGAIELRGMVGQDDAGLRVLFDSARGQTAEFQFQLSAGAEPQITGLRVAIVRMDHD